MPARAPKLESRREGAELAGVRRAQPAPDAARAAQPASMSRAVKVISQWYPFKFFNKSIHYPTECSRSLRVAPVTPTRMAPESGL